MGIVNIHMLRESQIAPMAHQAQVALQEKLIAEHRRGEHPSGMMRRECPLCQRTAA